MKYNLKFRKQIIININQKLIKKLEIKIELKKEFQKQIIPTIHNCHYYENTRDRISRNVRKNV